MKWREILSVINQRKRESGASSRMEAAGENGEESQRRINNQHQQTAAKMKKRKLAKISKAYEETVSENGGRKQWHQRRRNRKAKSKLMAII
jgi:hypothetical protein